MSQNDQVRLNALKRYKRFLDMLNASDLTIVHHEPGEDRCCEDVAEASKCKRTIARNMSIACIDAEITGHSTLQMILHSRKIRSLTTERGVLKTLLD